MAGSLNLGKVRGDTGPGVASGGTTGQFLVKKTGTDYDTEWRNGIYTVNNNQPDNTGNVNVDTGVMTVNNTSPTNGNVTVDTGVMTVNNVSPTNGNVTVDTGVMTVNNTAPTNGNVAVDTGVMMVNNTSPTNGNVTVDTGVMKVNNVSPTGGNVTVDIGVSNIAYDATNKKITKTVSGVTSEVVATSQLKSDMGLTKSDVGLANVDNTSDANKPVSTATQTALNAKANVASTVSAVTYDSANKKLTKTINGTTTDVVTVSTLKSDMSLNNVDNKSSSDIRGELTSSDVTTALGFTPTDSTDTITDAQIDALFD